MDENKLKSMLKENLEKLKQQKEIMMMQRIIIMFLVVVIIGFSVNAYLWGY